MAQMTRQANRKERHRSRHDQATPHREGLSQDEITGWPRRVSSWEPALVTAAVVALVACGDESATTEPPQPPPPTNRPPVAVGSIPAAVLESGEYAELNVAGYFSDPDGDPLTYALPTNSDPGVSIADSVVRIDTRYTENDIEVVMASDPHGEEAIQPFKWTEVPVLRDKAVLEALYHATGGPNWTEAGSWVTNASVRHWHGVSTDSTGSVVTGLDLTGNGLVGSLPANVGSLAEMNVLRIGGNAALSGRLPLSLTRVPLDELHYANTELCTPAEESFQVWLNTIPSHEGTGVECEPLSEREILEIFYDATGGPSWTNNDNWLTDAPLRDWYGLGVDEDERVVGLRLVDNNLTGAIPAEIGDLASLEDLDLGWNRINGPIPPELGNLANLTWLTLGGFDMTLSPIPPELGKLASLELLDLYGATLSGPIPPELGSLARLERLLLGETELTGTIPPELGNLANLERLSLRVNELTGAIPPELGQLTRLRSLNLEINDLSGSIPAELGSLTGLRSLHLGWNELSGPIPPELGDLTSLERLNLGETDLSGSIPRELVQLVGLQDLAIWNTGLSGPIPPEFGQLAELTVLFMPNNNLSGPIPPELGELADLRLMNLASNNLSGPLPASFGGLTSLEQLTVARNGALSGPLPDSLTNLRFLESLEAGNTRLCAPGETEFIEWLSSIPFSRVARCLAGAQPAYLTQAVQSREFPVPLVAGDDALLRVFPTAARSTSAGIPAVRARFYADGRQTHVENIPAKSTPIPTAVDESNLANSANARIPGRLIRPGLEMVIEIDPEGTLDSALGVSKRIPETGRLAVDVRAMPVFDLTLIPFLWTTNRSLEVVGEVASMADDPAGHELLFETRTLLPVGGLNVTAHEPVLTSTNNMDDLLGEVSAIRRLEGGTGYYVGFMTGSLTGPGGLAGGGRSSVSRLYGDIIAHELGHNMGLGHAPCGDPDFVDSSYPYPDGSIGSWGYDFRDGGSLVPPSTPDLMSYCDPQWIGDYFFSKALGWRLANDGRPPSATAVAPTKSLLVWGGVDAGTVPYLEPAFVVDAPPALPDSVGEYRVAGHAADGATLFSHSFAMPETADGDGSSSFAFVLPVRPGWEALASITLTGPGGSVTLDGETDLAMTILRNPRTGQVRGILRDAPPANEAAADAAGQGVGTGFDVLFSRGLPDVAAWRR